MKVHIGLVGKKHAGKTTIADYIVEHYNYTEYALAQPIKEIAKIIGFTGYEIHQDKYQVNEHLGICAREFFQVFGTEIGHNFKKYFPKMTLGSSGILWIHLMQQRLKTCKENMVISDIRFPAELKAFKETEEDDVLCVTIKVVRGDSQVVKEGYITSFVKWAWDWGWSWVYTTNDFSKHVSEQYIDSMKTDIVIYNDDDKQSLYKKIDRIMDTYRYTRNHDD